MRSEMIDLITSATVVPRLSATSLRYLSSGSDSEIAWRGDLPMGSYIGYLSPVVKG
jgi:hypothetical protein